MRYNPQLTIHNRLCTIDMKINYNNRRFKPVSNSNTGEVSAEMIFHYQQTDNILTCSYNGENIIKGHLIGKVDPSGCIDMSYHQVNIEGQIMTGLCKSIPEILPNGKIRLHEEWQWTSGDKSKGKSILKEI